MPSPLIDQFGRAISYLRLSVTDRCDLRCTYCMAERMQFLPRADLLTLEEIEQVGRQLVGRGVRKIRISGGEPLVRRDIIQLFENLGTLLGNGLDELTLTSNGTLLSTYAAPLFAAGVRRINISLDTLDPAKFKLITRRGGLDKVLAGIDAALAAGLKVKINTVALKGQNVDDISDMITWAHGLGMDMTLIEVMPMGDSGEDRIDQYIPLPMIRDQLETRWTLEDAPNAGANHGPARFVRIKETGGKLGFITPLTNNFCAGCNRVRITCTGRLYMCLGQDDHVDLREILRAPNADASSLDAAFDRALAAKPEKHDFAITERGQTPKLSRHMSVTGG
ncbi:MAG: GTP 3',8-cyclase MoaA [Hyphomonadaceae bacterium]